MSSGSISTDLSPIPALEDLTMAIDYGTSSATSITTILSASSESGWLLVFGGGSDDSDWKHIEINVDGVDLATYRSIASGGLSFATGLIRYTSSFSIDVRVGSGSGVVYVGIQKFT